MKEKLFGEIYFIFEYVKLNDIYMNVQYAHAHPMLHTHTHTHTHTQMDKHTMTAYTALKRCAVKIKIWFHVQLLNATRYTIFVQYCRLFIPLEILQLLHKNCSELHAINCTGNHVINQR